MFYLTFNLIFLVKAEITVFEHKQTYFFVLLVVQIICFLSLIIVCFHYQDVFYMEPTNNVFSVHLIFNSLTLERQKCFVFEC